MSAFLVKSRGVEGVVHFTHLPVTFGPHALSNNTFYFILLAELLGQPQENEKVFNGNEKLK